MKASLFSADLQELLGLLGRHGVRYLLVGGQAVIFHGHPCGPPNRVDLLASISGVGFLEAWGSRIEVPLEGAAEPTRVPLIGLAALLQNKRATGRLKDQADVAFLEGLREDP